MKKKALGLLLLASFAASQAASASDSNIIRVRAPIGEVRLPGSPTTPEDPTKAFYIMVGYHPNDSCTYKMRGYGESSVCKGVNGSYGSISNTEATVNGNRYLVRQVMAWKNGASCIYSFMVSGASIDAVPTTLQTTWNDSPLELTKSSRAAPLVTWDLTSSCSLHDELSVGDTLKVVIKES